MSLVTHLLWQACNLTQLKELFGNSQKSLEQKRTHKASAGSETYFFPLEIQVDNNSRCLCIDVLTAGIQMLAGLLQPTSSIT